MKYKYIQMWGFFLNIDFDVEIYKSNHEIY